MKIVGLQHSIYDDNTEPNLWASTNCKSYQGFSMLPNNSIGPFVEFVLNYKFLDDADAVIFALRWKRYNEDRYSFSIKT